jgi:methyl-accepting chemotaxis protein
VNEVAVKFRDLLGNLGVYREEFNEIRRRIEVISENYLTSMKLNLSTVFGEMVRELGSVSENVNEMLERSEDVERSMKAFIVNIQMEDVIRQQIDRVILLLEGGTEGSWPEEDDSSDEIAPAALYLALESLGDLEHTLSGQCDEVEKQCGLLSSILEGMQSRFRGGDLEEIAREQNRMDATYRRIEDLKEEFIRHMEEIISGKKNLLTLCESFIVILNEFEGLFKAIGDTVKRFEALNMITRIELARHTTLSRTLGGALNSVMALPAQMKRIVEESMDLYGRIRVNIVDAVERYAGNFRSQEEVLEGCIASMKKVSVKLYESQKYYWDISQEIGRYSERVLGFIEDKCAQSGMDEAGESLRRITEEVRAHFVSIHGDVKPDIEGVWQRIREQAGVIPAGSFFAALGSEIETGKSRERVIIF